MFDNIKKKFHVIGVMSGTSCDGIDVAAIETDGEVVYSRENSFETVPYDQKFKEKLKSLSYDDDQEYINSMSTELIYKDFEAIKKFLEKTKYKHPIDYIGYHGKTIAHFPKKNIVLNIGDGNLLAKLTGINVINDFRAEDIKNGGQGAPLAPVYHRAIIPEQYLPAAVFNIGGIVNVTYISKDKDLIAFDVSPGNTLMDDFIFKRCGLPYDNEGEIASSGKVSQKLLKELLSNSFLEKKPPKSLDITDYSCSEDICKDLPIEDILATLTQFTVYAISKSFKFFEEKPKNCFFSGGGVHNKHMFKLISDSIKESNLVEEKIFLMKDIGLSSDLLEAELMAFIAIRSVLKKHISFPSTTDVDKPTIGGVFCPAPLTKSLFL